MDKFELVDDFLVYDDKRFKIVISTAEKGRNFNRHTEDGVNTLQNLKKEFDVDEVVYLRQVHSDFIFKYDGQRVEDFIENEGDAIISDVKNTAIGIFTADCVPVIIIDKKKGVGSAIHSGWKGTYESISKKAVEKLFNEYGSNKEDLLVVIGPHIRRCCYEVSEELKEKFLNKTHISEDVLFDGRNLSMEEVITKDLLEEGILEENIINLKLCTYCSKEIKLHSYRKSNGDYGRLFTFFILK